MNLDPGEQTAIACLNRPPESCINLIANSNNLTMDARTIDNLEAADPSAETRQLIARWRDIVKPGIHRQSGGRWKKYHEPKFFRNERKIMEERLQLAIHDPSLLKTLVCLERQQHDNMPEEYIMYKKKLSTRYGLVFFEDRIIVPENLRNTIISLLHKGHPAINKMSMAARHFWWPKLMEAIQKSATAAYRAKCPVRTLNLTFLVRK